jgi:hypothetical protein
MISFYAPWFAVAGLIAAAGPILIHLLNRRRFKVVEWAAMDFLREAVFRSKRIMQFRDWLLLALRTLCILLFGLALARPFLSGEATATNPNQPVHAVALIDNSLSMGYRKLSGSLLDEAKAEARKMIEALPRGSRISVLPTCGAPGGFSFDAYYTKADALEALDAVVAVDRATKARETIDLAIEAARRVPTLPQKQVVLFADQQIATWPMQALAEHLEQVPGGIKLVEIKAGETEVSNAWVADVRVRDGMADLETPTVFAATIAYEGLQPRRGVTVTLRVEGQEVQSPTIDLQPGQKREIEFEPYQFQAPAEPGKPYYATAEVSLPEDSLPADDRRALVVPVVATLPVVFVDQLGKDEDPRRSRYGETFNLRRLLAPVTSQALREKQLIKIDQRTIDELEPGVLEDARLVVIAGVVSPGAAVGVLRQYVEQGGNLVIAAGGHFDPALWTQDAWLDGNGILPAPLDGVTVGRLPEETAERAEFFRLDFNSLKDHDYFAIETAPADDLRTMYAAPVFFKAAAVDLSDDVQQKAVNATRDELQTRQRNLADLDRRLEELSKLDAAGKLTAAQRQEQTELEQQRGRIVPNWLLWKAPAADEDALSPEQLAERSKPAVLARYENRLPFMVERRIGRGRVLLTTSGVYSGEGGWNTLALCDAVVLYDRVLRDMLRATLPPRNLSTEKSLLLPLSAAERGARFTVNGPGLQDEPVLPEALAGGRFALPVRDCMQRGVYRVAAYRGREGTEADARLWEIPLAFNGPPEESQLVAPSESELRQRTGQGNTLDGASVLGVGLQRAQAVGSDDWRIWLMAAVLIGLLVEMGFLAYTTMTTAERSG